jgi:hypothetical protein
MENLDLERLRRRERPPRGFSQHPLLMRRLQTVNARAAKMSNPSAGLDLMLGKYVNVTEFADPRHPDVFIIPRDRHMRVVDPDGEAIGFMETVLPFSSTNFWTEFFDSDSVFTEWYRAPEVFRLGGISQLGYLVPPRPIDWLDDVSLCYLVPQFTHTRWIHSLVVAFLMEVTLARNGFSLLERQPMVLTGGCHDIAMPAGGDSIKYLDRAAFDEETNFSAVMQQSGLAERWQQMFGLDLEQAAAWVRNEGVIGKLLDVCDKLSYTAIDCYSLGSMRNSNVRELCVTYPLVMDVWQDIQFNQDRTGFGFKHPERLLHFALLRAYEHTDLLQNPYSRAMDTHLEQVARPFYEAGVITKEQLLRENDDWLLRRLTSLAPERMGYILEPEKLRFRRFESETASLAFQSSLGDRLVHTDEVRGFRAGLHWPVWHKGEIVTLEQALDPVEVRRLQELQSSTRGFYVYYLP